LYWKLLSKGAATPRRKRIDKETRELIFRMVAENPTWGAPRIHGELLKLGFDISERTVSRSVERAPRNPDPAKRWLTFLQNHCEAIAAMDFFAVPTITFGLLYGFFIIGHDPPAHTALRCYQASDQLLGCTAITRGVSTRTSVSASNLRSRCEVRLRGRIRDCEEVSSFMRIRAGLSCKFKWLIYRRGTCNSSFVAI